MSRLNLERQKKLTPIRFEKAIKEFNKLGLKNHIKCSNSICVFYKDEPITYFPYSGWATGKTIKDGRGLNNLLKQIKNE